MSLLNCALWLHVARGQLLAVAGDTPVEFQHLVRVWLAESDAGFSVGWAGPDPLFVARLSSLAVRLRHALLGVTRARTHLTVTPCHRVTMFIIPFPLL